MHTPVLLNEVIESLNIQEDSIYVDCTLGLGGHSREILKRLSNKGLLIGIDQDEEILNQAKDNLKDFKNVLFFNENYTSLPEILKKAGIEKITGGVLLDLGVNSLHLDKKERGFSFQSDSPLDMRMDNKSDFSAFEVVNHYKEEELADIIYKYGEERFSRRIARKIVEARKKAKSIKTTLELSNIILSCYPKSKWFKTHPATKTFQAIRIEVNRELEVLDKFLRFIPELLYKKGRLSVISFHSLEDRIVKNFLKGCPEFQIITKKPITPSENEMRDNPRSRSSKLRIAEKI